MTEPVTCNCDETDVPMKTEPIFKYVGIGLGALSLSAGIVLFFLPLGILQSYGKFLGTPERSLWLLFLLCLAFGFTFLALGTTIRLKRSFSKHGGSALLVLGLASAVLIFLINVYQFAGTSRTSLWWLFVASTVLGGLAVYLPLRAERIELKAEEEKRKADEEARRVGPKIVRVKLRCM